MQDYDVIVIGSGSGMLIVDEALGQGLKVALVDKGLLGGTCPNLGCIPSKMLIYPADRVVEIQEAAKLGITAAVTDVDFAAIMKRMRKGVRAGQRHLRHAVTEMDNLDYYRGVGRFRGEYTLEVKGQLIRGERIFIASGTRPFIPPIKGLAAAGYLTNETVLGLKELPESVIIIGGGYIGVEYGHFLAAMGTRVVIVEMADRLVMAEEPEIAELLQKSLARRMEIHTNTAAEEVTVRPDGIRLRVRDRRSGRGKNLKAQRILAAVGRRPNSDLLDVAAGGIATDKRGFVIVDEYLETNKKNIFAVGDANSQQMFTHVANREAALVVTNAFYGHKHKMDYHAIPHAVYSHPQIAAVGLTEAQAREHHDVAVTWGRYYDVAKGEAMLETEGFTKAIVDRGSGQLLGFHIIGPYAPLLIQEVVNAMTSGGGRDEINEGIHIHPALSELIPVTLNGLEDA